MGASFRTGDQFDIDVEFTAGAVNSSFRARLLNSVHPAPTGRLAHD
jgi:hypothetical protein